MIKAIEIIKTLGNSELLVGIIMILIFIIIALGSATIFILKKVFKNVSDNFKKVIDTRKEEIDIVKKSIDHLSDDIKEIKERININNDTTTLLAYHQCMNEAMKWKEKGEIPMGAKMHFETVWRQYEKLGDGHGTDPKDMIDTLKVVA